VLVNYSGYPAFAHDANYYDQLVFNYTTKSVNGYYLENSHGRFYWQRAGKGTYGPIQLPGSLYKVDVKGGDPRLGAALQALSTQLDLTQFDSNGDGKVTDEELAVLLVRKRHRRRGCEPFSTTFLPRASGDYGTRVPERACLRRPESKFFHLLP